MNTHKYKLAELVDGLDVSIKGNPNCLIEGIGIIQEASPGQIAFLANSRYRKYLATTQAAAIILTEEDAKSCSVNAVISANPYYVYAKIATFFAKKIAMPVGIHPTAVIGENCQIDFSATIGAHCVIGNRVKIAANAIIGAGTIIGHDCVIEEAVQIDARVTLYDDVRLGKRTRIASGVVIGSDGFGFANQKGTWYKVPQLGGVIIGDDVEIGANTTIDRGAVFATIIENGVKLDNLIQVGHNVKIGANTVIAGCVAIAGSTEIGKNCMIGGASCFAGHITICDQAMITGMTAVTKSIYEPGVYSSGIVGAVSNHEFRKNNARFHRLENTMQRIKNLELAVQEMTERKQT